MIAYKMFAACLLVKRGRHEVARPAHRAEGHRRVEVLEDAAVVVPAAAAPGPLPNFAGCGLTDSTRSGRLRQDLADVGKFCTSPNLFAFDLYA